MCVVYIQILKCCATFYKGLGHLSVRPFSTPWNFLGQNTGMGITLFLLQGVFPTQGPNPGLPICRQILYQLSHKGSPGMGEFNSDDHYIYYCGQESLQKMK